jgi:HlyD family secretion protein
MRVSRILPLLVFLTIAVPIGVAAYTLFSSGGMMSIMAGGGETTSVTLPNGQTMQVPVAAATQIASGQFPGGGQAGAGDAAASAANANAQFQTEIAVLGSVAENDTATLTFPSNGTVSEVFVQAGDYVEAGTVLARLDAETAQIAYNQAQLTLENAEIALADLLQPPDEDDIEIARLGIVSAQGAYSDAADTGTEEQIAQQQIRYQQAIDAYNLEVQQRANMNGSDEELALQDAAVGEASFNMEIERLRLEELQNPNNSSLWQAGVRVQIAQLQYDQLFAGSDAGQVANAELNVEIARVDLAEAEANLRQLEIISPIAGVITEVNINVGDTVTSSSAAIGMTNLSQLWLTAPINELDLDQVSEGMNATITLDALPDETFTATIDRIEWIGVETDGIVEYDAWFLLTTDDARVRPGMTGEANIEL